MMVNPMNGTENDDKTKHVYDDMSKITQNIFSRDRLWFIQTSQPKV